MDPQGYFDQQELENFLREMVLELRKEPSSQENLSLKLESFYTKLLSSRVYVILHEPLPDDAYDDKDRLKSGTDIPIHTLQFSDGTPCIPVFTSMLLLKQFIQTDMYYAHIYGWDLLNLVRGTGVMLNNNSEYAQYFPPSEIERVLEFFNNETIVAEQDSAMMLGRPEVDPIGLKEALSEVFSRDPDIYAAYICLGVKESNGEKSYIVVVDHDPAYKGKNPTWSIEGNAARGWLPKGYFIDFLSFSEHNSFTKAVTELGECFYRNPYQNGKIIS